MPYTSDYSELTPSLDAWIELNDQILAEHQAREQVTDEERREAEEAAQADYQEVSQ